MIKRLYINNLDSVPWDIHTQKRRLYLYFCVLKFYWIYIFNELTNDLTLSNEEIFYNVWYWKEFYTQNQLIQAINLKLNKKNDKINFLIFIYKIILNFIYNFKTLFTYNF